MTWPDADVNVNESLVRTLLVEQFPHLADLACHQVGEGFDNSLWRLGEDLVVRIPRREMAVELVSHELRWLSVVVKNVTLNTPAPLLAGVASERFAWPWIIGRWIDGVAGDEIGLDVRADSTVELAMFLRQVHVDAPDNAPLNAYRGVALIERAATFDSRLRELRAAVDTDALSQLWQRSCAAPRWDLPARWLHGDFHPGNTIYRENTLVGVIDFGDLCAGDPATDLAGALMSLPFEALDLFFSTYGTIDEATMQRTIGWALMFGVYMTSLGLSARASYLAVGRRALTNAASLAAQVY